MGKTIFLRTYRARTLMKIALKIDKTAGKLSEYLLSDTSKAQVYMSLGIAIYDLDYELATFVDKAISNFEIQSDKSKSSIMRSVIANKIGSPYKINIKSEIGVSLIKTILRIDRVLSCLIILSEKSFISSNETEKIFKYIDTKINKLSSFNHEIKKIYQNVFWRKKHVH